MPKAPLDVGHKAGYFKVTDREFLEVGKRREVTHSASSEPFRAELVVVIQANPKSIDQWK